jgi:hypothetical protein
MQFLSTPNRPNPGTQVARASNIGFGSFADLGRLSVDTRTTSWLRVSFDGDIVVVTPSVSNLGGGTHRGTVIINSERGGSASIAVTLNIEVVE